MLGKIYFQQASFK